MRTLKRSKSEPVLLPRLRIVCGREIALGPGKVELLALVLETGSITEAAARMDMSYMRAWTLIKTMNACFREPLVRAARGGKERGGATLTETGKAALTLYRELEDRSRAAMVEFFGEHLWEGGLSPVRSCLLL